MRPPQALTPELGTTGGFKLLLQSTHGKLQKVPSVFRSSSPPAAQPVGLRQLDPTQSRKAVTLLTETHEARRPSLTASCRNRDGRLGGNKPDDTIRQQI